MTELEKQISQLANQTARLNENVGAILTKLPIKTIKDMSFEEILRLLPAGQIAEPVIQRIRLDTATNNFQIGLGGNFLGVIAVSSNSANVDIRFNKTDTDAINFTRGLYMIRPYYQVFLTWAAQTGAYVDILMSAYAKELMEVMDFRTTTQQAADTAEILDQLKGSVTPLGYAVVTLDTDPHLVSAANTSRRSIILQAHKSNTSITYIGFDANVTTSKYVVALSPGESYGVDDYQGAIYASNVTATDKISYGEV